MKFFTMIKTDRKIDLTYLKSMWRAIALKNHPDKGGNTETFKEAQKEYDTLLNMANAGFTAKSDSPEAYGNDWEQFIWNVSPIVREKAQAVKPICTEHSAELEVCGTWIWISQSNPKMAKQLKAEGMMWAAKKQKWFFAGTPKARRKGSIPMDTIRSLYGSETFREENKKSNFPAIR